MSMSLFLVVLTVVLAILKVGGTIAISWWVVFLPVIVLAVLFVVFFAIGLLALLLAGPRW